MGRKPLAERPMTPAERQARRRREPAHIVVEMNGAWRLSAPRYGKLLAAIRAGSNYDLDALGSFLGVVSDPHSDASAE